MLCGDVWDHQMFCCFHNLTSFVCVAWPHSPDKHGALSDHRLVSAQKGEASSGARFWPLSWVRTGVTHLKSCEDNGLLSGNMYLWHELLVWASCTCAGKFLANGENYTGFSSVKVEWFRPLGASLNSWQCKLLSSLTFFKWWKGLPGDKATTEDGSLSFSQMIWEMAPLLRLADLPCRAAWQSSSVMQIHFELNLLFLLVDFICNGSWHLL